MSIIDVSMLRNSCLKRLLKSTVIGKMKSDRKGYMIIVFKEKIMDVYKETPFTAAQEIARGLSKYKIYFYIPEHDNEGLNA